jgi:hypothetical protein
MGQDALLPAAMAARARTPNERDRLRAVRAPVPPGAALSKPLDVARQRLAEFVDLADEFRPSRAG